MALLGKGYEAVAVALLQVLSTPESLEGVAKSQSPIKAVVFKSQQPCPDTVSLDLDPLLHAGVVGRRPSPRATANRQPLNPKRSNP